MVVREGRQAVFVTVPPFLSLSLSCAGGYFSGLSVDRSDGREAIGTFPNPGESQKQSICGLASMVGRRGKEGKGVSLHLQLLSLFGKYKVERGKGNEREGFRPGSVA